MGARFGEIVQIGEDGSLGGIGRDWAGLGGIGEIDSLTCGVRARLRAKRCESLGHAVRAHLFLEVLEHPLRALRV